MFSFLALVFFKHCVCIYSKPHYLIPSAKSHDYRHHAKANPPSKVLFQSVVAEIIKPGRSCISCSSSVIHHYFLVSNQLYLSNTLEPNSSKHLSAKTIQAAPNMQSVLVAASLLCLSLLQGGLAAPTPLPTDQEFSKQAEPNVSLDKRQLMSYPGFANTFYNPYFGNRFYSGSSSGFNSQSYSDSVSTYSPWGSYNYLSRGNQMNSYSNNFSGLYAKDADHTKPTNAS
ncbi:hypothetical protein PGT21_027437 [Puccinia graminis f. sp. tritici]|nr:hypothetical protein PGTUg99_016363 [Puccinia graminis f. sp. tritici]KAA1091164.1 hypothetical protein PGT21_027437 [Puccinia graminis f. sp. tritici]